MNVTSFYRTVAFMNRINFARNFTSPMPYEDIYTDLAYPFFNHLTFITTLLIISSRLKLVGEDTGAINYNKSSLTYGLSFLFIFTTKKHQFYLFYFSPFFLCLTIT